MTELAPMQEHAPELEAAPERLQQNVEQAETLAETDKRLHNQAEQARNVIENLAQPQPLALPVDDKADDNRPVFIDKAIKTLRARQSLKHIQRKLPAGERALSKIVHQPAVKAVSEVSAKTITRPSGLFGGGVMAFAGSLLYLYLAKHIGFRYNYLLFSMLFIGGFVIGLMLEISLKALRPKSQEQ